MPENTATFLELTPHEKQVLETKALRVYLDGANQRIQLLTPSRSTSLAKTKVDEAIMWLGQNLKELGTADPYPNSRDITNTVIDPTADNLKF